MDKQKSNDGNARDLGRDGAGSSMGKDMGKDTGNDMGRDMGRDRDMGSEMDRAAESHKPAADLYKTPEAGKDLAANKDSAPATAASLSKSAEDMHKTIDKAAQAAQPMVDRMTSTAHAGVDKLSSALAGASGQMDAKKRQLADAYGHFAESGREYVRSSPVTAVAIAAAAGWMLSKLLGPRR